MPSLNRVQLIGHIGKNIENKTTSGGTQMTRFSIKTVEVWKSRIGEKMTAPSWHNCIAWGRLAEVIARIACEGCLVYAEGKIEYRNIEEKGGYNTSKKLLTEIKINAIRFLAGTTYDNEQFIDECFEERLS